MKTDRSSEKPGMARFAHARRRRRGAPPPEESTNISDEDLDAWLLHRTKVLENALSLEELGGGVVGLRRELGALLSKVQAAHTALLQPGGPGAADALRALWGIDTGDLGELTSHLARIADAIETRGTITQEENVSGWPIGDARRKADQDAATNAAPNRKAPR